MMKIYIAMAHFMICNSLLRSFRYYSIIRKSIPDIHQSILRLSSSIKPSENSRKSIKQPKVTRIKLSNMTIETAKIEIMTLLSEIQRHDKLYYEHNTPEISDAAYDKLRLNVINIIGKFPELKSLVPDFDTVSGTSSMNFAPYIHHRPMLSLDNAFNIIDIEKFLSRHIKGIVSDESSLVNIDKIDKIVNGSKSSLSSSSSSTTTITTSNTNMQSPISSLSSSSSSSSSSSLSYMPTISDIEYIIEPKIDGLSLSLTYEYGVLTRAGTRGDGTVGEDVTDNVRLFTNIPIELPTIKSIPLLEIRGEIYMAKSQFHLLNTVRQQNNEAVYANCRNAAAGTLRMVHTTKMSDNNTNKVQNKPLKFFAYNIYIVTPSLPQQDSSTQIYVDIMTDVPTSRANVTKSIKKKGKKKVASTNDTSLDGNESVYTAVSTQENILQYLSSLGFSIAASPIKIHLDLSQFTSNTSKSIRVDANYEVAILNALTESIWEECEKWAILRESLDYEIDGLVLKVNTVTFQNYLGQTRRAPRWAIAYKFPADEVTTELLDIIVQVSRSGVLTPVAVLRPVSINGVEVSRATLHNEDEVNRLGLGAFPQYKTYLQKFHESATKEGIRSSVVNGTSILPVHDAYVWKVVVKRAGDVIPKIIRTIPPPSPLPLKTDDNGNDNDNNGRQTKKTRRKQKLQSSDSFDNVSKLADSNNIQQNIFNPHQQYSLPTSCPVCGSKTVKQIDGGVAVKCTGGLSCSAQAVEQLAHFCSRDAVDITGLGLAKLEELYQEGYIKTPADIYKLRYLDLQITTTISTSTTNTNTTNHADMDIVNVTEAKGLSLLKRIKLRSIKKKKNQEDLSTTTIPLNNTNSDTTNSDTTTSTNSTESFKQLPSLREKKGWGDRSVNNLLNAIDERRNIPFAKFLYALGIAHIGEATAKDISHHFESFTVFWSYLLECHNLVIKLIQKDITKPIDPTTIYDIHRHLYMSVLDEALEDTEKSINKSKKKKSKSSDTASNTNEVDTNVPLGIHLLSISGLGCKAASNLIQYVASKQTRNVVQDLLKYVTIISDVKKKSKKTMNAISSQNTNDANISPSRNDFDQSIMNTSTSSSSISPSISSTASSSSPLSLSSYSSSSQSLVSLIKLPLENQKVVFTGKMKLLSRSQAYKYCEELGGEPMNSVNKETTLLIVADDEYMYIEDTLTDDTLTKSKMSTTATTTATSTAMSGDAKQSSKVIKARKLKIPIWSETQFMTYIPLY